MSLNDWYIQNQESKKACILTKESNMKKVLIVLLVSMIVAAGVAFAGTEGTDQATLTLGYTKALGTSTTIGWYDGSSTSASSMTSGDFGNGSVNAYLKITNDYASHAAALSVVLPNLTNDEDATTISYSATVSLPSGVSNNAASLSTSTVLASSATSSSQSFASVSYDPTLAKTGIVLFVFAPTTADLSAATANTDYSADVVVTLTSES